MLHKIAFAIFYLYCAQLEIWDPGRLPEGITIAKLSKPHHSIPPNPLLANPIYLAGYIERMGTGTGEIIKTCREKNLKTPQFSQQENFRVVIWRTARAIKGVTQPRTDRITPRQKEILNEIRKNAGISRQVLAKQLKVNVKTIARDIDALNEMGILNRTGSKRKGEWIITKQVQE